MIEPRKNIVAVKKMTSVTTEELKKMATWMYAWWGQEEGYSYEAIECFILHSLQVERLPQTYGAYLNGQLVGMYQFSYDDLVIRPDIYPWLCNVYLDSSVRGQGIGRLMLETVIQNAKENTNWPEFYLYTTHNQFYEKFGWTYVSEFDTYTKNPRIQKLYKLKINSF